MSYAASEATAIDQRVRILQGMALFGAVDADTLQLILDRARVMTLTAGEFFLSEGEEGDAAYLLEEGSVEFFKIREGREYRIRTLDAGECFGQLALLGHCPRSGYVRALTNTRAIRICYDLLFTVYAHNPRQYMTILMNMARDMSRRLRDTEDRLIGCMAAHATGCGDHSSQA
ncbi:MAG: Crp/Fnr family transcriptional regulator [Aquisalimonadaceae bacterium]